MALIEKPCRRNRCMSSSLVMGGFCHLANTILGMSRACPRRVGTARQPKIPLRTAGRAVFAAKSALPTKSGGDLMTSSRALARGRFDFAGSAPRHCSSGVRRGLWSSRQDRGGSDQGSNREREPSRA